MSPKVKSASSREKGSDGEIEKKYVISFTWMILLTLISFILVGSGVISTSFLIPIILLLATVQVVLQLVTFMHLKEKGHAFPVVFVIGAAVVAATCIVAMVFWA